MSFGLQWQGVKGKHSKLKASEDLGTAVTQTSQKSRTKKNPESTTEEDFLAALGQDSPQQKRRSKKGRDDDSEEDEASRIKRALKREEDELTKEMEGEANDKKRQEDPKDKKPQEKGKRRKKA